MYLYSVDLNFEHSFKSRQNESRRDGLSMYRSIFQWSLEIRRVARVDCGVQWYAPDKWINVLKKQHGRRVGRRRNDSVVSVRVQLDKSGLTPRKNDAAPKVLFARGPAKAEYGPAVVSS